MSSRRKRNNSPVAHPQAQPAQRGPSGIVAFGQTTASIHLGPLPPPEVLKRYDDVVPGAAERIMKLAELQSAHRQQLEKKAVDHEIASSRFGQFGALVVALLGTAAGAFIAWLGQTVAGTGVIGGTIGAIAIAYVTGTFSRARERSNKAKLMAGLGPQPSERRLPAP